MNKTWMLDTNLCSFIMREQPEAVLKRLAGTPIGPKDTAIVGHAIAAGFRANS